MAHGAPLKDFEDEVQRLESIDTNRVFRESLGEMTLRPSLNPKIHEARAEITRIKQAARELTNKQLADVTSSLRGFVAQLAGIVNLSDGQFLDQRDKLVQAVDDRLSDLKSHRAVVIPVILLQRGLLDDLSLQEREAQMVSHLNDLQKQFQEASDKRTAELLAKLEQSIGEKEARLRKSAKKISMQQVQEQFANEGGRIRRHVYLWATVSLLAIVVFGALLAYYILLPPSADNVPTAVYHVSIRVAALGAAGGLVAFALRLFRAHLHMLQHNAHRSRLSNSVVTFVESAELPENRDAILMALFAAVADLGTTGLVESGADDVGSAAAVMSSIGPGALVTSAKA